MSNTSGDKPENERFLDALVEELRSMNDTEALEGEDPEELLRTGERILQSAKAEAGRKRRERAKQQLSLVSGQGVPAADAATVSKARAYLRERSSSQQLTLAARGLEEMSDADVMVLYNQLRSLEPEHGQAGEESIE